MRWISCIAMSAMMLALASAYAGDPKTETPKPETPKADTPKAEAKKDFSEFSKLLHRMVVKEIPKEIEDDSGWGPTIPLPDKVILPKLQRTFVKVGDRLEVPHGTWKRFRVTFADPAKDVQIAVKDFTKVDAKNYKLAVDAEAVMSGEGELKQWKNGVALFGATAQADAVIGVALVIDVNVSLVPKKFPPELSIKPKLADLKVDLKEFNLKRVNNQAAKILEIGIEAGPARQLGNELKGYLQTIVKKFEPQIMEQANEAIAQSIKEGKGTISASSLLKVLSPAGK